MISKLNSFVEKFIFRKIKKKIKANNITILSNNCTAGVIYHLLGMKFYSPTINLYISPDDFVAFLENIDKYLSKEMVESVSDCGYPVGKLGDITIHFKHYSSFEEAKAKWEERAKRINKGNIVAIMTDRITATTKYPYRCDDNTIVKFDNIPILKKVVFTSKKFDSLKSTYFLKEYSEDKVVGIITDYSKKLGKRNFLLSDFDLAEFLNNGVYWE